MRPLRATILLMVVVALNSGCYALLGSPNAQIGSLADAQNRRINAKERATEPPSKQLPTQYEAAGSAVDRDEWLADWKSIFDLFRSRPAREEFRDEPSRCLPEEVLSCSATLGCTCKAKRVTASGIP